MRVIAINGSPRKNGNTFQALQMVGSVLEEEGITVEHLHIGMKSPRGCMACYYCIKMKNQRCVIEDDIVNEAIQAMSTADGILFGSPEYYASIAGGMKSFLDRIFLIASANGGLFRGKVGAGIAISRRSGGIGTFMELNKFLLYSEMILPTSMYWNQAFGMMPDDVQEDIEGKQIMRVLGKNMAWLLAMRDATKDILPLPKREEKEQMNFIR